MQNVFSRLPISASNGQKDVSNASSVTRFCQSKYDSVEATDSVGAQSHPFGPARSTSFKRWSGYIALPEVQQSQAQEPPQSNKYNLVSLGKKHMLLCLFKHGEKLEVCNSLLYRMVKEPVTNQKRFPTSTTTLSQRQGLVWR